MKLFARLFESFTSLGALTAMMCLLFILVGVLLWMHPPHHERQRTATQIAVGFVEAVRDRIPRVEEQGHNRLDQAELEHFRRWVGGERNIMQDGVTQDLTRYMMTLSNRFPGEVDGVGRAEISRTIGTVVYRFGQRDCQLFLNRMSEGWRVTSTDCSTQ
ncbi:MAG: hypothetical protein OXG56_01655 [Gammaproteobacteria bacterium]|nr:hypothetical protein [Gammaproteobacteria bacterium]